MPIIFVTFLYSISGDEIILCIIKAGGYFKINDKTVVSLYECEISILLLIIGIFYYRIKHFSTRLLQFMVSICSLKLFDTNFWIFFNKTY
jgi:hypothetical protein